MQRGGRQGPWIGDSNHMLIARVEPAYPPRALSLEREGSVLVEFTITANGSVRNVRIIESTDSMFERSAAQAVAKARYRPRIVDGVAVEVNGVTTLVEFRIGD